jgi:hypothetical protein
LPVLFFDSALTGFRAGLPQPHIFHFSKRREESMAASDGSPIEPVFKTRELKKLTIEQIRTIDDMLASLGDYGELHLVVQHGELRYINKMESFKVWKNETK